MSLNFDSFHTYIIYCYNESESFYKIGRTFRSIEKRLKSLPYKYEIIQDITFEDGYLCCQFEQLLHNKYKNYKYSPLLNFKGKGECYKINRNNNE